MFNTKLKKTKLEAFADAMTHGIGLFFSLVGNVVLILNAALSENTWIVIAFSIYGISLISTYLSSTMYHLYLYYHPIPNKKFKRILLLFDHCSIFFLIAGTYTPILLVFMRNALGWSLFFIIWFLTFSGIISRMGTSQCEEYAPETPVTSTPASSARCTGAAPRNCGNRLGWMFSVPRRGMSRKRCGRKLPYAAVTIRSTSIARSVARKSSCKRMSG